MKKRIFIMLDLPDEIKRELLSYDKKWKNLHIKWTNFYKLYLIVRFLGEVDKKKLELILLAMEKTASEIKPFYVSLDKIILGPDEIQAKMFWVMIYIDANIKKLGRIIEQNLNIFGFEIKDYEFKPHIILARAKGNQLKGKKTNVILKNMKFKIRKMEVMESQLRPKIEKYKLVESFEFKE